MQRVVSRMLGALARMGSADAGATMPEWVLVVFLIAVVAISAAGTVGESVAAKLLDYVNLS